MTYSTYYPHYTKFPCGSKLTPASHPQHTLQMPTLAQYKIEKNIHTPTNK